MLDRSIANCQSEALDTFTREQEFVELAKSRLTRISPPATLGGYRVEQLFAAAASAPEDDDVKDRMVLLLVNDDCSSGNVGEGKPDRPLMYMAAYLINATPEFVEPRRQRKPSFWKMTRSLFAMIDANGGRLSFIVLADDLSKAQAKAGKQAVFDLLGLRRYGGWLINESRH